MHLLTQVNLPQYTRPTPSQRPRANGSSLTQTCDRWSYSAYFMINSHASMFISSAALQLLTPQTSKFNNLT